MKIQLMPKLCSSTISFSNADAKEGYWNVIAASSLMKTFYTPFGK